MEWLMEALVGLLQGASVGMLFYGMALAMDNGLERALANLRHRFGRDVAIRHLAAA